MDGPSLSLSTHDHRGQGPNLSSSARDSPFTKMGLQNKVLIPLQEWILGTEYINCNGGEGPERTDRPRDQGCSPSGCYALAWPLRWTCDASSRTAALRRPLGPPINLTPEPEEKLTGRCRRNIRRAEDRVVACFHWCWMGPAVALLLLAARRCCLVHA